MVDNGLEFVAYAIYQWASKRNIDVKFIERGRANQNRIMERFNRIFRVEALYLYVLTRLKEAQVMAA
jgi:transposase InsO family protein